MQIPDNREENILPSQGVGVFFLKEGEVVALLICLGHGIRLLADVPISQNGKIGSSQAGSGRDK